MAARKFSVFITILAALTFDACTPAPAVEPPAKGGTVQPQPLREKWAVLVGAGEFQDPSIARVRSATRNVADLALVLKDPALGKFSPLSVITLTGDKANKAAIEDALSGTWLVKKALPNDLVVIYLCGRTMPAADGKGLYFCAFDTLASDLRQSGIALADLAADLKRRIQSKRMLLVLDTSPGVANAEGRYPTVEALSADTGVSVLSAAPLSERSVETSAPAASIFTASLVEGITAGGGMLPLTAIAQHLSESVPAAAQRLTSKPQIPVLAVAADAADLKSTPFGAFAKPNPNRIVIGHKVTEMPLRRPDLAARKPAVATVSDDDEDENEQAGTVDFGSYMTKMKQTIQKKWQPPKGFESRRVVSVFTILRDGSIVEPAIVDSSGIDAVDQSALAALKAASPLDPLPLGAPKSVQIRYQFVWQVNRSSAQ